MDTAHDPVINLFNRMYIQFGSQECLKGFGAHLNPPMVSPNCEFASMVFPFKDATIVVNFGPHRNNDFFSIFDRAF